MLTQDFCKFLEFHLTETFSYSPDPSIKSLWCDGVLLPPNENNYSKKSINDKREVWMNAFIGKDGQGEYSLLIKFGNRSLSRYAKGLDIAECVPNVNETGWYQVDLKANKIIIQLR